MRMHHIDFDWDSRRMRWGRWTTRGIPPLPPLPSLGYYGRRMRRHRWSPLSVGAALIAGAVLVGLMLTLLALALAGAAMVGGVWLGYRVLRAMLSSGRTSGRAALPPTGPASGKVTREARGLLEMARTPDPLDRYLLAVEEFDRISTAVLAVDPADLGRRRTAARSADLAEQAFNLHDAVAEIERQVALDARAGGALANVWELSMATGELWSYTRDLSASRAHPTLHSARAFITRRTALLSRRDALIARLRDAELRAPLPAAHRIPVRSAPRD